MLHLRRNLHSTNVISSSTFASHTGTRISSIIRRLEHLDTAVICDADKYLMNNHDHEDGNIKKYTGIRLMNSSMVPRNIISSNLYHPDKIVGVARTVQVTTTNDFLAVLQGLDEAQPGEVLCVDTKCSTKAVAGGLFCQEADRKQLAGLIVDGPIRDINSIQKSKTIVYSTSVTPYSGTVKCVGIMQPDTITCGGVDVKPGDIIVGDFDGVIVGSIETMEALVKTAENIAALEFDLMLGMNEGRSLHSMTNFTDHLENVRNGKDSSLQFMIRGSGR